jgi:putative ABC transport system permease protein
MKFFPLIWAQLWRKKARTIFTLLSLVAAFLLLGLLQAADSLFNGAGINNSGRVLITQARVSFTNPLPLRLLPRLEAVPGVEAVSWSQFFGGIYIDQRHFFPQFAVNPDRWLNVFRECTLPPDQLRAWKESRAAAIAGRDLMNRFGWKVGDRVPLVSQIFPQKDGSRNWAFDIVGVLDDKPGQSCGRLGNMYIRYEYFDEARQFGQGNAGVYALRIRDPSQTEAIANTVDAMFENSPDETKTQTERDFALNLVRQIGDLSLILHSILGAVFFAILMLTGNTMSQVVQERVPELAVLKTLGFTDNALLGLVLAESLLMCVLGGLAGMGLAVEVMNVLPKISQSFPPIKASLAVWELAVAAMIGLGLVVGTPPALRARRLSIVDALADR